MPDHYEQDPDFFAEPFASDEDLEVLDIIARGFLEKTYPVKTRGYGYQLDSHLMSFEHSADTNPYPAGEPETATISLLDGNQDGVVKLVFDHRGSIGNLEIAEDFEIDEADGIISGFLASAEMSDDDKAGTRYLLTLLKLYAEGGEAAIESRKHAIPLLEGRTFTSVYRDRARAQGNIVKHTREAGVLLDRSYTVSVLRSDFANLPVDMFSRPVRPVEVALIDEDSAAVYTYQRGINGEVSFTTEEGFAPVEDTHGVVMFGRANVPGRSTAEIAELMIEKTIEASLIEHFES